MLMVISPAKNLDYESELPTGKHSQPDFLDDACELIDQLKELEPHQVSNLMGISDKLGQLKEHRSGAVIESWFALIAAGDKRGLTARLMADHYDPAYLKARSRYEVEVLDQLCLTGLAPEDRRQAAAQILARLEALPV